MVERKKTSGGNSTTGTTGPGFRGVGSSGYEQNPKTEKVVGPPVLLEDGVTILYNGKTFKPGHPKYSGLFFQIQISSAPESTNSSPETDKFYAGLLKNDPNSIRIRNLMIENGLVTPTSSLQTVVSAYRQVIEDLASFKAVGQVFTIEQMITQIGAFNQALPRTGAKVQTGPSSSISEVDYGTNKVGDKSQGARQARKMIQGLFRETLGRVGTEEEIEEMRVALVKAAARSKPVTTVTRQGNKTITKTTPGFDLNSWASGYIATKFADEDVAGTLGQAQDQLRALARAYGVDMGESWYATAAKQVGKGTEVASFLDEIKQTAIGRYPGLADRINKGSTTSQIASPYLQAKARILEVDADSLDLDDIDIQQAIGYKDATGNFSTKPLWQFEQDIRRKPEWQYTQNARSSYDSVMLKVLRDFGLMG